MKRALSIVPMLVLSLGSILPLFSESGTDDSDQLFEAPPEDQVAPEPSPANLIEKFTTQSGIRLSGSFEAYAGVLMGWQDRPNINDLERDGSASPIASLCASLNFDARPVSFFRVWASLSVSYPTTIGATGGYVTDYAALPYPTFAELFCDYSLYDAVFFRIGKQIVNWGAARFFAIDNLPARVPVGFQIPFESFDNSAGIGLKVNVPIGVHSLTAIMQIKPSYLSPPDIVIPHIGEIGYGLSGELLFGNTELSVGGYYQEYIRPRAMAGLKTSLFGIDLQAEAILAYTEGPGVLVSWVGNLFWEQKDVRFRISAEYIYNAESGQPYINDAEPGYPTGHAVACLAGFREIFGTKIDVGVQWEHAFLDNSGIVVPAVVFRPFEHLSFTCGFPVVYGPITGEIMNINPDPMKRRTSLGIKIDISGSF